MKSNELKIVSGGQTGVDRGALQAAMDLGLEWGGWAPKGWRAENGTIPPIYRERMQEHASANYLESTKRNVIDSHATLIIVNAYPLRGGTLKTRFFCQEAMRPHFVVSLGEANAVEKVISWLRQFFAAEYPMPLVLNVAGPRESKAGGIQKRTRRFLAEVLDRMMQDGTELVKMLIKHPERADKLETDDWWKLDGDLWGELIAARPELRSKGPENLSWTEWGRFFARVPQCLKYYPAFQECYEPSFWAGFLSGQPEFADRCPWKKLKGRDWAILLCKQPQFAGKCTWDKLDRCAWARLLAAQPQFADKCPFKDVLTGRDEKLVEEMDKEFIDDSMIDKYGIDWWGFEDVHWKRYEEAIQECTPEDLDRTYTIEEVKESLNKELLGDTIYETIGGYRWPYRMNNDGTARIGAPSPKPRGNLEIPGKIGGHIVTSVREFGDCNGLRSVTIPDTVTCIEPGAFVRCRRLTDVKMADLLTSIGDCAFFGCRKMADTNGYVVVRNVLHNYNGPEISLTIPDSATRIGGLAFYECGGITSVTIHAGVTEIAKNAFDGCSQMESFTVSPDNPVYASVDGFLLTKDGKTLLCGLNKKVVAIPVGVTHIADGAFADCGISSVTFPPSVTSIGVDAFQRTPLESVTFPVGMTTIEKYAFFGCGRLKEVTIPSSVTSIARHAFAFCRALKTVRVSSGDAERVKKMLKDSGLDMSKIAVEEEDDEIENSVEFANAWAKSYFSSEPNPPEIDKELTAEELMAFIHKEIEEEDG